MSIQCTGRRRCPTAAARSRAARSAAPRCSCRSRRSRRRRSAGGRRAPPPGRRAAPACPRAARRARAGRARAAAARFRCRRRAARSAPAAISPATRSYAVPCCDAATDRPLAMPLNRTGASQRYTASSAGRAAALSRSYASWPTWPRPCGAPAASSAGPCRRAGAGLDEQQEAIGRLADDDGGRAGERAGDRGAGQQHLADAGLRQHARGARADHARRRSCRRRRAHVTRRR